MQKLQVPAKVEHLEAINAYIDTAVPGHFLPLVSSIKLAAEEFFVNIYSYAYSDTTGTVEMECGEVADSPSGMFLLIKDWGPPFNPFEETASPDITLDIDSRPIGGLGVYLIKQMSQSQHYRRENGANIIELIFTLPQPATRLPSFVLPLLLAFGLAFPGVLHAQNVIPGTILSDERETVMIEAVPVSKLVRRPVPVQQNAENVQATPPTPPGHPLSIRSKALVTENLLHDMDVYALSPHARFLSLSYRGVPSPRLAYRSTPARRPVSSLRADVERWADSIAKASRVNDLPEALIAAVIQTESAFNPTARSSKGAQGLMQIMPDTQRYLGLTDPSNPEANIMAGSRYLKEQMNTFGSLELALAAYNAGPGNVQRHGGIPPFAETQGFVRTVLFYME
ncbi:MAG: transglycosylase SLT domain-containing protein [Bilophila sp.]